MAFTAGACASAGRRGPAGQPPTAGPATLVAVFPIQNLSGEGVPYARVQSSVIDALRARGVQVVEPSVLEPFLARHRFRYTGGVDPVVAKAMRDELDVAAVLVTSVQVYAPAGPPKFGIAMRLVSTAEAPAILWADSDARTGNDAPGFLSLGVVRDVRELERRSAEQMASSLVAFLAGKRPRAIGCERRDRTAPRSFFRSSDFAPGQSYSIAVLPFLNFTDRSRAGEAIAVEFLRELHAVKRFEVLDPGRIRERILAHRIIMEDGISLHTAKRLLDVLEADLVLVGDVYDYSDSGAAPVVGFSFNILDRRADRILWRSTSYSRGDDGVYVFDVGAVTTTSDLACHMIASIADKLQMRHVEPPKYGPGRGRKAK